LGKKEKAASECREGDHSLDISHNSELPATELRIDTFVFRYPRMRAADVLA
jgi:hypothetical protein